MNLKAISARLLSALVRIMPGAERVFVPRRQAGVTVTEDTALTLAEWWACVSVISRTVAALPWRVYERSAQGRRPLDNAVAWLLDSQPNPEMTAFSFREALMAHVLNWGNGYAEIQRDLSGRPVALWLITPDRVCLERRDSGALYYKVTADDGTTNELDPANVFHVHGLGFDGLVGYSPVRMAARSIGIGIAQDTFAGSFYQNGTVLGTVVEIGANMNKEQIQQMEAYLNERHGGPSKAFGVKVSPNGTKVHQIGMPLNDAQFIESRQFTVTMAARWLGVPPHKIADLTRSTNNNIEHQGIEFVTDAIVPWAKRMEQEADVKLFGARAQGRIYTKLSVNALMRGDSQARANFYAAMVRMGAMSINEVRELEELNGIGKPGDAHLVQLNQTTLEWLVDNPGAKADAKPSPDPANADAATDPAPDPQHDQQHNDLTPRARLRHETLRIVHRA
ncbi:MAG TPA: phage portal protein [Burkholderiaceae bacterium]|nr:phage portal protein [Burkholderiaceae bacterium]